MKIKAQQKHWFWGAIQHGSEKPKSAVFPLGRSALSGQIFSAKGQLGSVSDSGFRRLHRRAIVERSAIRSILNEAKSAGALLTNGVDRRSTPRSANVVEVTDEVVRLTASNINPAGRPQIYFSFSVGDQSYFFASPPILDGDTRHLVVHLPKAIYEAERRELRRTRRDETLETAALHIADAGVPLEALVRDTSYHGVGLRARRDPRLLEGLSVEIEFRQAPTTTHRRFGTVRYVREDDSNPGWVRIGLAVSAVKSAGRFPVESRDHILEGGLAAQARRRLAFTKALLKSTPERMVRKHFKQDRPPIETVSYLNSHSEEIVGIIDRSGRESNTTGVVVPPAWGKTKEAFLALARTIVATFSANGHSVCVLRFDGTNRRGESFINPENRSPGDEHLAFRFSRAVDDVRASIKFLKEHEGIAPDKTVLVTFSLGAIEGRKAVAEMPEKLAGWISIVGMVDLQSGLRVVSGGVDYLAGVARGVAFGHHELVGAVANIDFSGRDALDHKMVYLEDAKRDMSNIDVPVTWLHGRDDAWMDLDRVRDLMAAGSVAQRRLVEIPTGHQMRTSREAIETFQLVATEVASFTQSAPCVPTLPDLVDLDARSFMERARRPAPKIELAEFWRSYLLGRSGGLGYQLLSATSAYNELMTIQTRRLALKEHDRVLDLGSGNGDLSYHLSRRKKPTALEIVELDLVGDALARSRRRMSDAEPRLSIHHVSATLELDASTTIPLVDESADAILASLVLSYLERPDLLVDAIVRLLRPDGVLVISSLKRDADISRLYVESIAELPPDRLSAHFGVNVSEFHSMQRNFLNDAAKLLELEERGKFRFFDAEELEELCKDAGLTVIGRDFSFGVPPQAIVVTATKAAT